MGADRAARTAVMAAVVHTFPASAMVSNASRWCRLAS